MRSLASWSTLHLLHLLLLLRLHETEFIVGRLILAVHTGAWVRLVIVERHLLVLHHLALGTPTHHCLLIVSRLPAHAKVLLWHELLSVALRWAQTLTVIKRVSIVETLLWVIGLHIRVLLELLLRLHHVSPLWSLTVTMQFDL